MAENKVRFGLKNVHYAVLTESATAAPSWGTPVAINGAVSLDLAQEGNRDYFYADNVPYYLLFSNQGYTGSLEIANVPDAMLKDIFGYYNDTTNKVLAEDVTVEPKPFALLFEVEGDQQATHFVLYRCYAQRPNIGSATITDSKEVQTMTVEIAALPLIDNTTGSKLNNKTVVKTTPDTTPTVVSGWYSAVFDDLA